MIAYVRPSETKSIQVQWRPADNTFFDTNYSGEPTDSYKPGNKVQFTPWTRPNSDRSNGNNTGIAVTSIGQNVNNITASNVLNFNAGTLTENSWWEVLESIGGNVTLNPGRTLTVTPGTTASFASGAILIVNGNLQAVGTGTGPSQKITFTRSGASGTWGGILFGSSGSGNITYATITHATKGVRADFSNSITVRNCTIQNFIEQGVNFNAAGGTVQNSTINNPSGASHGIYVNGNSGSVTLASNAISGAPIGIGVASASSGVVIRDNSHISSSSNAGILVSGSPPEIYRSYIHN